MSVGELLRLLEGLPPDALVLVPGYEGDWDLLDKGQVRLGLSIPNRIRSMYYGDREETTDTRAGTPTVFLGEEN